MTIRHSRFLAPLLALTLAMFLVFGLAAATFALADEVGTGSITNGGTNFREGPGKKDHSIMKLDRGTVVTLTSIPDGIGEDFWYGVSYAGKNGYVNSEFIRVISGAD